MSNYRTRAAAAKHLAALANMTSDPRDYQAKLPVTLGQAQLGKPTKENECRPIQCEKTAKADTSEAT